MGRVQTPEHIAKRMASIAVTRARWTPERRAAYSALMAETALRRDPETQARFMYNRRGKPAWWANSDMTPSGPRRTPDEKAALKVERQRRRRAANPSLRLHERMGALVRLSLRDGKAGRSWESLVGYTRADLMAHLESLFTEGMTWDNAGQWHIDHVIPRAAFAFATPSDPGFRACWALSNLQPLWAADNLRKAARLPRKEH